MGKEKGEIHKPDPESKPSLKKFVKYLDQFQGTDSQSLERSFASHLKYTLAKDEYSGTTRDFFKSLAYTVRDRLVERWTESQQTYYNRDAKRVYYLSMEFLIGRLLGDALINLGLTTNAEKALMELGYRLEDLRQMESDAGLGNGGLGRLAAGFMDSMATLELPAYGYGIRYEYGIFSQKIQEGFQVETPDQWLRYGNPWEIERPEYIYLVRYYGQVKESTDKNGKTHYSWTDTEDVVAMAYDTPIPGYRNNTVNDLRLWSAKATRDFNLKVFNAGDYDRAMEDKIQSESISKVLYPRDDLWKGRELRLKQEYFLVSASLQDIIRRYKKAHKDHFTDFPEKVAIQLNDTHPALAIPELMRILIDEEGLNWEDAWNVTVKTFGYTNHTVMSEALEKWTVERLGNLLPRHLQIIYQINQQLLDEVRRKFPNDPQRLRRMSLIEEGLQKQVRMANLCITGSHSVNGVAALHTEILKNRNFKDFYELWPKKFNNKTNGITQRRWLCLSNPSLAELISEHIGEEWITDLYQLRNLEKYLTDATFRKKWQEIKHRNKINLADYILRKTGFEVPVHSIFDIQVKRIHEYKRQLMNALHVITLYNKLKANPEAPFVPRTVIFGGKAAPAYFIAKLIIKLINSIAEKVNSDPDIEDKLKVVFLPNYGVTLAQLIIPAADLSEQISTAGYEASGTGNMKFALNGALTIGTLDGANVELREEIGEENIFIFGLTAEEVARLRESGYNPLKYYNNSADLKKALDMISSGYFSPKQPALFQPIINSLLNQGDHYLVLADFEAYIHCQQRVSKTYLNPEAWTKMSILNVSRMGKFSSDRTIREYAREIWNAKPVSVQLPKK